MNDFFCDDIAIPYVYDAAYAREQLGLMKYREVANARLIGKGSIELSDISESGNMDLFLALASYVFEVYDITDHWFDRDDD